MSSKSDAQSWAIGRMISLGVWTYTVIAFLLKLTRWIDWSWWAVFTPIVTLYTLAFGILILAAWARGRDRRSEFTRTVQDLKNREPGSRR